MMQAQAPAQIDKMNDYIWKGDQIKRATEIQDLIQGEKNLELKSFVTVR